MKSFHLVFSRTRVLSQSSKQTQTGKMTASGGNTWHEESSSPSLSVTICRLPVQQAVPGTISCPRQGPGFRVDTTDVCWDFKYRLGSCRKWTPLDTNTNQCEVNRLCSRINMDQLVGCMYVDQVLVLLAKQQSANPTLGRIYTVFSGL